jgi:hypothetical protein
MLVTIHLAEGQTVKQLIGEVTRLAGGVRPRSVSGRFGVLVDAELAYRYLAARYAPPPPPAPASARVPVLEPTPPPAQAVAPAPAVAAPAPAKKATARKTPPKATTAKGE